MINALFNSNALYNTSAHAPSASTVSRANQLPYIYSLHPHHIKINHKDKTLICAAGFICADLLSLMISAFAVTFTAMLAGLPFTSAALSLPLLALLIPLYALNHLYPAFGLSHALRLRAKWRLGAALMVAVGGLGYLLNLPPLTLVLLSAAQAINLIIAPILEHMARAILHKTGRFGKPVHVAGQKTAREMARTTLLQNWHLGLNPVEAFVATDTLVIAHGSIITPETTRYKTLMSVSEGGVTTLLRPTRACQKIIRQNPHTLPYRAIKRSMDVAIGSMALVMALPILLICASLIYAIDRGSPFYAQNRSGKYGTPMRVWKMRSMYKDSQARLEKLLREDKDLADEWYSCYKLKNDPRILPFIGRFMRKFSIDELPQLWGVITGELSLVGPRVFADYDLAIYSPEMLNLRQSVKPGLTGLWQVSVRSDGSNEDKIRYDAAYVHTWSIWSDLDILYRTVGVVITGRGAV